MRCFCTILALLGLAGTACSEDKVAIGNAKELREFLTAGRPAVSIEALASQRGCGPSGCSIDIGGVSIDREKGVLLDAVNKKQVQIRPQVAGELPDLDWEPLGGFAVSRAGKRWGTCLEFSHSGLGKSGRYQRWTTVMLVPWMDANPGNVAYRFVGYWAGCDVLTGGEKADEISLPTVEWDKGSNESSLQIVWHSCTASGCKASKDTRTVNEDADSETGALIVGAKP